jgi:hypothetical protein
MSIYDPMLAEPLPSSDPRVKRWWAEAKESFRERPQVQRHILLNERPNPSDPARAP